MVVEAWDHRLREATELLADLDRNAFPHQLKVYRESTFFEKLEQRTFERMPSVYSERRRLRSVAAWIAIPGPKDLPRFLKLPVPVRRRAFRGEGSWWTAIAEMGTPCVRWLGGFVSPERARYWGWPLGPWTAALRCAEQVPPRQVRSHAERLRSRIRGDGTLWVQAEGFGWADPWFCACVSAGERSLLNVGDLSLSREERPLVSDYPGGTLGIPLEPVTSGGIWGPVLPFSLWPPYEPGESIRGTTWVIDSGTASVSGVGATEPRLRRLLARERGRARPVRLEIGLNPGWEVGWGFDRFARGVVTLHLGGVDAQRRDGIRLGLSVRMGRCYWVPCAAGPAGRSQQGQPPSGAVDLTTDILKPPMVTVG